MCTADLCLCGDRTHAKIYIASVTQKLLQLFAASTIFLHRETVFGRQRHRVDIVVENAQSWGDTRHEEIFPQQFTTILVHFK